MLPSKFKTKPYNHQINCLNKHGRSTAFALLSEMGTGKTWIIVNNIADLWSSNDCDAVLVLAPNGVHSNWTRLEFPKHMPDWVDYKAVAWSPDNTKKFQRELESLYAPKEGCLRILTMNWEGLQHKRSFEEAMKFASLSRRLMIVCDESDAIKNPQTARYKALMKLKKYSHWRRIMSGTPINNAPFDAFGQFSFLDENILLTTSFYAFKAEYAEMMPSESRMIQRIAGNKTPWTASEIKYMVDEASKLKSLVLANGREELITMVENIETAITSSDFDEIITMNEKLRNLFDPNSQSAGKFNCLRAMANIDRVIADHQAKVQKASSSKRMPQIVDKDKETGKKKYKNLDKLSKLIAPHSFRVLKSDCLDLPDKIYKTAFFELTKEQREIYKKAEEECRLVFEDNETPFSKLVSITKLAQIASGYYIHPLADEPVKIPGDNPKLSILAERVQASANAGEKTIVWARYTQEIKDITERLRSEGLTVVQYFGDTSKAERVNSIEEFENGDADVFVGNQQAGGTGITLVSASHVIYFSNNFSLRDRLQSEDRAHRIGQTKNVVYTDLVGINTIEEKVITALQDKKDIANIIIDVGMKLFSHD